MHPLEVELAQTGLNAAQRLGANITIFRRDDPTDLSFGLESEHFVGIENEVLLANAPDDLPALGNTPAGAIVGRSNLGQSLSDFLRLSLQNSSPLDSLPQPRLIDW